MLLRSVRSFPKFSKKGNDKKDVRGKGFLSEKKVDSKGRPYYEVTDIDGMCKWAAGMGFQFDSDKMKSISKGLQN